jgi:hypothetical protein
LYILELVNFSQLSLSQKTVPNLPNQPDYPVPTVIFRVVDEHNPELVMSQAHARHILAADMAAISYKYHGSETWNDRSAIMYIAHQRSVKL